MLIIGIFISGQRKDLFNDGAFSLLKWGGGGIGRVIKWQIEPINCRMYTRRSDVIGLRRSQRGLYVSHLDCHNGSTEGHV